MYRSDILFTIAQRTLGLLVTNFWTESSKLTYPTFTHHTSKGGSQCQCENIKWWWPVV